MDFHNILIVKLSAIGDVIHAMPVAYALKQKFPQARITWVVEKAAYELLTNSPAIDDIILFEKTNFKSLAGIMKNVPAFSQQLKTKNFDLALDLQGLFKSAAITYLSGAPIRKGYCNMRELSQFVSTPVCGDHQHDHVVDRYLDVARALGCTVDKVIFPLYITPAEQQQAEQIAAAAGLNINKPYVVLAPGTNWPTKCWPTGHFAELAIKLQHAGIQPVIIGGPGEKALADEIVAHMPIAPIVLVGKTSLKQLASIIRQAKAFIGGDTGPMHLAVAVGTPVVALFGPTDPKRNGPYQGNNVVIQADRPCINCWRRKCDKPCMTTISVKSVLAAAKRIIVL